MANRCATDDSAEGEAHSGSLVRVLANRLGIVGDLHAHIAEAQAQFRLMHDLLGKRTEVQRFSAPDVTSAIPSL
jgi:hypothetical protein